MLLSKARRGRKKKTKRGLEDNNTNHSSQMAHRETRTYWWGLQTYTSKHMCVSVYISLVGLYATYFLELQEWDSMELS